MRPALRIPIARLQRYWLGCSGLAAFGLAVFVVWLAVTGVLGRAQSALIAAGLAAVALVAVAHHYGRVLLNPGAFAVDVSGAGFRQSQSDGPWVPWSAVARLRNDRLRRRVTALDGAGRELARFEYQLTDFPTVLRSVIMACGQLYPTGTPPAVFVAAPWHRRLDVWGSIGWMVFAAALAYFNRYAGGSPWLSGLLVLLVLATIHGLRSGTVALEIAADHLTVRRLGSSRAVDLADIVDVTLEGRPLDVKVAWADGALRGICPIGTDPFPVLHAVMTAWTRWKIDHLHALATAAGPIAWPAGYAPFRAFVRDDLTAVEFVDPDRDARPTLWLCSISGADPNGRSRLLAVRDDIVGAATPGIDLPAAFDDAPDGDDHAIAVGPPRAFLRDRWRAESVVRQGDRRSAMVVAVGRAEGWDAEAVDAAMAGAGAIDLDMSGPSTIEHPATDTPAGKSTVPAAPPPT